MQDHDTTRVAAVDEHNAWRAWWDREGADFSHDLTVERASRAAWMARAIGDDGALVLPRADVELLASAGLAQATLLKMIAVTGSPMPRVAVDGIEQRFDVNVEAADLEQAVIRTRRALGWRT